MSKMQVKELEKMAEELKQKLGVYMEDLHPEQSRYLMSALCAEMNNVLETEDVKKLKYNWEFVEETISVLEKMNVIPSYERTLRVLLRTIYQARYEYIVNNQ